MDAAGVGKIITISQALFEGMTPRNMSDCKRDYGEKGPYPGGCLCKRDEDCKSRKCCIFENVQLGIFFVKMRFT